MLRRLRKILSILSLLFALATLIVWFRSRSGVDGFTIFNQHYAPANHFTVKGLRILASRGELWIHISKCDIDLALNIPQAEALRDHAVLGWNARFETTPGGAAVEYLLYPANPIAGFSFQNGTTNRRAWVIRFVEIAVPLWLASLLLCLPSLMYVFGCLRRRHRLRRGLCPTCGYDLRATPTHGSECGAANRDAALSPSSPSPSNSEEKAR